MAGLDPPYGFALRKDGSCLENQSGNGTTVDGFRQCCPKPSFNRLGACCPTDDDCMVEIKKSPHCADESWELFRNTKDDGYFCCLRGKDGYRTSDGSGVGCQDSNVHEYSDLLWQPKVTTDDVESTCPSTSNSGAIVGGVVGGVAGLAIILALLWYFMRRRSQKPLHQEETPITEAAVIQSGPVLSSDKPNELNGQGYVAELENTPVHELLENPRTQ